MSDVLLIIDAGHTERNMVGSKEKKLYVRRVDYGTGLPESEDDLATEPSGFMIYGITGDWKHLIA